MKYSLVNLQSFIIKLNNILANLSADHCLVFESDDNTCIIWKYVSQGSVKSCLLRDPSFDVCYAFLLGYYCLLREPVAENLSGISDFSNMVQK